MITIGDVPKGNMSTSDALYEQGRRIEGGQAQLEQASFLYRDLSATLGAYLFPKRNPYIAEPGLDNMLYIARENDTVNSIDALSPHELQRTFQELFALHHAYSEITPTRAHVISTSFHVDPIYDQSVFGKKVHVQSLPDLHFHAFAISEHEASTLQEVRSSTLSKGFQDYMDDPFNTLITNLLEVPSIQEHLVRGTSSFTSIDLGRSEGIKLSFRPDQLNDIQFYEDLQIFHSNLVALYGEITSLFIDTNDIDHTGMPRRRSTIEAETRLASFLIEYQVNSESVIRWLSFLAHNLKSGEDVRSNTERVFLRGCAYTMYMAYEEGETPDSIYFAPRLVSTGNGLSALGFFYQKAPIVDETWLLQRDLRQEQIRSILEDQN